MEAKRDSSLIVMYTFCSHSATDHAAFDVDKHLTRINQNRIQPKAEHGESA
jgi:hypothetical protein